MITRQDYLNAYEPGDGSHQRYYEQFVNDAVKALARRAAWIVRANWYMARPDSILKTALSQDQHLNNIPVDVWDSLSSKALDSVEGDILKQTGEGRSVNAGVCILKAAAVVIVREGEDSLST